MTNKILGKYEFLVFSLALPVARTGMATNKTLNSRADSSQLTFVDLLDSRDADADSSLEYRLEGSLLCDEFFTI